VYTFVYSYCMGVVICKKPTYKPRSISVAAAEEVHQISALTLFCSIIRADVLQLIPTGQLHHMRKGNNHRMSEGEGQSMAA
jgi:hypothetical protein